MKNLRKRVIVSGIVAALICGSSASVDAGVFPWVWNVFFGPADAPWFGPNNGGYYAGYGPGYYRPACRLRRRMYRPFAPAFAPAYPAATYPVVAPYGGGCNTGCAPMVSYGPVYDDSLSYSSYVVNSGCSTGCAVAAPAVAPISSQQYETERPAAPASNDGGGTPTDEAPAAGAEGAGAGEGEGEGESRDGFRTPSSSGESEGGDAGEFMPPVGGAPEPAPSSEPGASRESQRPVFVSTEGLNKNLSDDSVEVASRTLTPDVRGRLAGQRKIRWISIPRDGAIARR